MKRTFVTTGAMLAALALVALIGLRGAGSFAQATATPPPPTPVPSPTPPFSATFVAEAEIAGLPPGDAVLSVSSFSLPPGTTTQEFVNPGPVLIRVQTGFITLDADQALVTHAIAPIGILAPLDSTPGPADDLDVAAGQQILLSAGVHAQIRNPGTQPATLLVITLTYAAVTASPTAPLVSATSPAATPEG